ncbi:MAG TPA: hypothetical protein VGK59_17020, partial [Ohtaekwangia sp.]
MKRSALIIILVSFFAGNLYSQCNEFYVLENGTEWEMENYNAKEKLIGKNQWKVTSYTTTASGYTATVHSSL